MSYVIVALIVFVLLYATVTKHDVYNGFAQGVKGSVTTALNVFPYLMAMFFAVNLLKDSVAGNFIVQVVSLPLSVLGIPKQLAHLVLLRPFSGSASLTLLSDIFATYGVDSYIGRCASVIMSTTDTVFYVSAVYFAQAKVNKTGTAVIIALFVTLLSCVLSCLLCKVM